MMEEMIGVGFEKGGLFVQKDVYTKYCCYPAKMDEYT